MDTNAAELEHQLDPLSAKFREVVASYDPVLSAALPALRRNAFSPFAKLRVGVIPRKRAFGLLQEAALIVEQLLQQCCASNTLAHWLPLVRRFPAAHAGLVLPIEWVPYSTLAIIKWCQQPPERQEAPYALTDLDFLGAARIAILGALLAEINGLARCVGKGAKATRGKGGDLHVDVSDEIRTAIESYEARRPEHSLFADLGLHIFSETRASGMPPSGAIFCLGTPAEPNNRVMLKRQGETLEVQYLPMDLPFSVSQLLAPYSEALEDLFGVTAREFNLLLVALSGPIWHVFIPPDDPDELAYDINLSDPTVVERLSSMIGFCRTGFLRDSPDAVSAYVLAGLRSLGLTDERARHIATESLPALAAWSDNRQLIDVRTITPLPLIYGTRDSHCFVDFFWVRDFLCFLLNRAKEWFSSQHGDRFTLAVKQAVEARAGHATVVSWKTKYGRGRKVECDLLVKCDRRLYAIECKAFAKSRDYWLGDPTVTNERTQLVASAAKQAAKVSQAVAADPSPAVRAISANASVEWVLCLPTQEYLNPVERYGFLSEKIPRVCTPEELLAHFARIHEPEAS